MVRVAKPSGKTFASLEPQTKHLSEKAIRRRWKRLPVTTQTKLEDLLRTIEQSALASGNNEPQNSEVQTIVGDLVDQLIERIPRMPFPPGTNDSSFDFESVINHQHSLGEHLTTNTHTTALLSAETDAESELLHDEKAQLQALEDELTGLHQRSTDTSMRLHSIVRDDAETGSAEHIMAYESYPGGNVLPARSSDIGRDAQAAQLVQDLQRRLDTIEKQSARPNRISSALAASQAAFDVFNSSKLK